MNINDLTLGQLKELLHLFGNKTDCELPYEIGKIYLIRTVTMIDTGRLVAVTPQELVLEDCAWIADTGRFADAIAKAEFGEVEPFPDGKVIISRGAIVDAVQIKKAPRSQR